jgi:hypothetical protein
MKAVIEEFDFEQFFKDVEKMNIHIKSKEDKAFTIDGQIGNTITWTTKQVLPHVIYTNYEIVIIGSAGSFDVWVNSFKRSSRKFNGLSIEEAVVVANELRTT